MIRTLLTASVATAAMLAAAPAFARPGGGGSGAGGPAGGAAMGAMSRGPGGFNAGGAGSSQISGSIQSRIGERGSAGTLSGSAQSSSKLSGSAQGSNMLSGSAQGSNKLTGSAQGSINERSDRLNGSGRFSGSERLSADGAVPGALFPGLTAGLSVQSSAGATVGTVANVITARNGEIAGVVVTAANGQSYRVPASALSISGNVVTVNAAEAFERGSVPSAFLPGLSAGLTVDTSTGANFGTITSIQAGHNGEVGSVTITAANGQTFKVPANSLSISGNVVTLNTAEAFERGGVPSSLLPGLTSGLTVNTAAGASFGTISQVMTGENGAIEGVVVTSSTGQKFVLPASALSISGNVVTVANAAEAFENRGIPSAFLPNLSTGLTVNSSTGASLGTISQVVPGRNGTISAVVVTSTTGQVMVVPASDLSISGGAVTMVSAGI